MLHAVGLVLYIYGFFMLIAYLTGQHDLNLVSSLALWFTAIDLFILGHAIEGNVGAMTLTILFKYFRFKFTKAKKLQRGINCLSYGGSKPYKLIIESSP
jgi:hypothetical protein